MGKKYPNQAGKGDTYRPVDVKKYNDNFDSIKWKSKDKKDKK
jgi:hypothetical protein